MADFIVFDDADFVEAVQAVEAELKLTEAQALLVVKLVVATSVLSTLQTNQFNLDIEGLTKVGGLDVCPQTVRWSATLVEEVVATLGLGIYQAQQAQQADLN